MDSQQQNKSKPGARSNVRRAALLLACASLAATPTPAQTSPVPGTRQPVDPQAAWLTYSPVDTAHVFPAGTPVPDTILRLGDSALENTAANELHRGFEGMLHRILRSDTRTNLPERACNLIVVGTASEIAQWRPSLKENKLAPEGFHLRRITSGKDTLLIVEGADERGSLYGSFALLRMIAEEQPLTRLDDTEAPSAPVRWTNEWDNPNGSIERGYGGRSIFFESGSVRDDLTRASQYARLLASVGINGCTINNVNADPNLLRVALDNLLGNAWKFTGKKEHPRIEFGSTKAAGKTVYFVRDNGAGLSMEHAPNLFGPFQRLHRDSEFEGTGIGLAIVQRVIHKHGGQISAEAEVGRGATFYFTLG